MKGKYTFNLAEEETYEDGQTILKEGTAGDWVYVVLTGSVEISKAVHGKKYILEILNEGEVFGELGFIGGIKRTATATAIGDTTVGIIDREFLEKEYNQLSGQFRSILKTTALRFKKVLDRVINLSGRAEPRVPMVLSLKYKNPMAFVSAYTANASNGGLFVNTGKPLAKGKQFILKLELPGAPGPLKIKCEVRWVREQERSEPGQPPGMGIEFLEMSKGDSQLLKKCVAAVETGR